MVVHVPGENEYPYPPVADAWDGGPDPGPGLAEPPPKPRRRRRTGRIIALVAGSLVVLIVLAMVGLWLYADHALHRVDAISDYPGRPAAGAGTNWLIVGSDSRQGLSSTQANRLHTGTEQTVTGGRTDTIVLLHLPGNGTKPTMVSLLRDSYVTIPGHDQSKINAAFAIGGPQLLVRTVEANTGLVKPDGGSGRDSTGGCLSRVTYRVDAVTWISGTSAVFGDNVVAPLWSICVGKRAASRLGS